MEKRDKTGNRPAVFLDRDGTLIEDRGYLRAASEVVFFSDTVAALRRLRGFELFVVTNQSGIGRGLLRPEEAQTVNDHVVSVLKANGVDVCEVYCCPHVREDQCECIKPNPYFPRLAARDHDVDLAQSFVVGDHPSDMELAANIGGQGVYVLTGHGEQHRGDLNAPCEITTGISQAVEWIGRRRAVQTLRRGGLVAFPTETVYGLGADATCEIAVRRIFDVKGRPETHPLIVHLGDPAMLSDWAAEVPVAARRLADRFWPGPLTLVLPRSKKVSTCVTGGQDTVALRVPSHPTALAMLREFGDGVAAPSANRFGRVSPTTADHVWSDLGDDVDFVLDGGPCEVGVESTIVGFVDDQPVILRPGCVTREDIEKTLGLTSVAIRNGDTGELRAPGQCETHYAPRARVMIVAADERDAQADALRSEGCRVMILSDRETQPQDLYASLRRADEQGADVIVVALPPDEGVGAAVVDRLRKAAGPHA